MKNPLMVAVALGSALAGALVAALAIVLLLPMETEAALHSAHAHQTSAISPHDVSDGAQTGFYSEMTEVNARMHEGMAVVPTGDVNRDFVRMMIPHHQGAIDMALVLLKHEPDERLRRLAQSIIVEQREEITYMRTLADSPPASETASSVTVTSPTGKD